MYVCIIRSGEKTCSAYRARGAVFGSGRLSDSDHMSLGAQVRAINRSAERMFGWKEEELLGRELALLMPTALGRMHQGYVERYLKSGQKASGHAVGRNRKVRVRAPELSFGILLASAFCAGANGCFLTCFAWEPVRCGQ